MSLLLDIDSAERVSGTPSRFRWVLPTSVARPRTLRLLAAEIPWQVYNIRSPYNVFSWREGSTLNSVTVPEMNYSTVQDLTSALQTAANNHPSVAVFTFSVDTTTFRVSLTSSVSVTIADSVLGAMLGFATGQSGTGFTATNAYTLGGDTRVYLRIRNLPSSVLSYRGAHFLLQIPVDGGYVVYDGVNATYPQNLTLTGIPILSQVEIDVIDWKGLLVPLTVDWSLALSVDTEE
jgi:hypothetical protein